MTVQTQVMNREPASVDETRDRPIVAPRVDIHESEGEFLILADMPGVGEDELDVRMDGDELTITGRREAPVEGGWLARELTGADYRRVFRIPELVDAGRVAATLTRGVLRVSLPKADAARPRRIRVKAG